MERSGPRGEGPLDGDSNGKRAAGLRAALAVLAIAVGGVAWAGCGDDDGDSSSVGGEAQEQVEQGIEEGKQGVEEGAERAKEGLEEGRAEAEEGIEKGKEEAEKGIEKAEEEADRYLP